VFVTHGFRRAQVQDVADALGVSKGALYGYAAGKSALFAAAVRYADGVEPQPERARLPVPMPGSGELAGLVRERLAGEVGGLELTRALSRPGPPGGIPAEQEFEAIVGDLYRRLSAHRTAIKLVDRCAPEFPELRQVWFEEGRAVQVGAVAEYLRRRAESGDLVVPGRVELVARSVIELCVLWAVHRHWDPAPTPLRLPTEASGFEDDEVVAMLTHLLGRAVRPDGRPTGRTRRTTGDPT
jgi:AcrR family transcriptional regulator